MAPEKREREDLAALFTIISRRLIEEERPLLDAHGLTMWEYIVLSRLIRRAAPSQLVLAQAIGYDKTRLIALLDGLVQRGLVAREADPSDRRAHLVTLTEAGRELHASAQADIRAMESRVLGALDDVERSVLLTTLPKLARGG
jgi:DNA-binding MarR family transcriptional regulator